MAAKPRRYPKEENFRRLPDDKATRNLIDAMLDMRDPAPWNERPIPDALPPLAKLARRIEQEADARRNVRLKPETAKKIALALYTVADGPITIAASFPRHVAPFADRAARKRQLGCVHLLRAALEARMIVARSGA